MDNHQAEQPGRDSERILEEAQRITHVGSWTWNVETGEVLCSAETYRIYGEEPFSFQVTAGIFLGYVHPEDREYVTGVMDDVQTGRTGSLDIEFRIVRKDGNIRYIHSIGEVTGFTRHGKPHSLSGTGQDVTDRKLLERQLEDERDFVTAVLQTSGAMITVLDRDGKITRFNKACEELTGYTADEVIGQDLLDLLIPRDEHENVRKIAERLFKGEARVDFENHWVIKSGEKRFIRWRNSILFDERGKPAFAVATGIDITDRKRAEEALRESEASLKRSQEIAHLGSWEFDLGENRLTWSEELYRIFGLKPREFGASYEAFLSYVHPGDRAAVDAAYMGSVREGRDSYEIEHRVIQQATGEIRFMHEKCYHVRDEHGRIIRSLGMTHDITERKRAEEALHRRTEELEAAYRDLESFSYSVSHDLRTPLNAIQGFSNILLKDYGESLDEQSKAILNHITAATGKMSSIIDDLLVLARISRSEMECRPIDLGKIANGIVDELRQSDPGRTVTTRIAGSMPALADSRFMTITLSNLIGNAWKYTGQNPDAHIDIGIMPGENENVFFIRDNGAGFDMRFAHKLFQPFQRLHSDSQFAGTGIGLAIVHRIIQRHRGKIWAESETGKGSVFYFTVDCTTETSI